MKYSKWDEREGFIIARSDTTTFFHVFESEEDLDNENVLYSFTTMECLNSFLAGVRYEREKEE